MPALVGSICAMLRMVTQLNSLADRPGSVMSENTHFNGV